MKRLHMEYGRSGWDLTGFPVKDRPVWRRLLPPALARGVVAPDAVGRLIHYRESGPVTQTDGRLPLPGTEPPW